MAKRVHIALLIEPSTSYGRGILRGVAKFARSRANWIFEFEHAITPDRMAEALKGYEGVDGIIARSLGAESREFVRKAGIPMVLVGSERDPGQTPCVSTDNGEVGRMVARYLIDRGFKRFAGVGFPGRLYSAERIGAFREYIEDKGLEFIEDQIPLSKWDRCPVRERTGLIEPFIESLEAPVGVLACNDGTGRHVVEACRRLGRPVPEDISVVGVDNDEVLCELSNPPLSSVDLGPERIGYRASRVLARLLAKRKPGKQRQVDPIGVTTRRSSDQIVITDPLVKDALRYIWEYAADGISVEDLVGAMDVSRRWLEVRFRRELNSSPAAQIRNVRVERAKKLLAETDMLIPDVAAASGFGDAKLLIAVFRRLVGLQPTAYRKKFRLQ
jgi:LacI family transcriptional regulator